MANFSANDIYGNIGVRYVHTNASSDYYARDLGHKDPDGVAANDNLSRQLSTGKASYSDVLPSLNIAYDINEEWVLRAAAAQVISRPNYADMFLTSRFDGLGDVDPSNQTVTTGSISLKPLRQRRPTWRWNGITAPVILPPFTYFIKDVNNFTTFTSKTGQSIGVIDPRCNCDNWTIINKVDGTGGMINGLELQWQHSFENGFGAIFNYTYADARADKKNFSESHWRILGQFRAHPQYGRLL